MSIADELGKLDALRKQGVISDSEFEERKRSLLNDGKSTSRKKSDFKSWDDVPTKNRWSVQWLLSLLIAPLGVLMLILFKSYRKKRNEVVRVGSVFKIFFGALALFVWTGVVAQLAGVRGGSSSSSTPQAENVTGSAASVVPRPTPKPNPIVTCDSSDARDALKNAIEQNATAGIDNSLLLLDVQEIKEISLSPDGQTRNCQAVLFLNSGRETVTFELLLTADKRSLLVEINPIQ